MTIEPTLRPDSRARMRDQGLGRGSSQSLVADSAGVNVSRPPLEVATRTVSGETQGSNGSSSDVSQNVSSEQRPVASGNGIQVYITLAEPVLFLQGLDNHDSTSSTTTMLRGSLILRVSKSIKIKAVTLNFRGKARTEWPEGIPPRKNEFYEEEIINRHTWPFFNAQFSSPGDGHGADYFSSTQAPGQLASTAQLPSPARLAFDQLLRSGSPSPAMSTIKEQKRRSLQMTPSGTGDRTQHRSSGSTVAQKGYMTFQPGDYVYHFELPLDSRLPESINVELGTVKYKLEAVVDRAGAFRANVIGTRDVTLIRVPSENSLEQVEPIAISRNWEDQLHYDIIISGKSFPLGAQVPIAFKLIPLAKIQCHRIRIFVTENVEYYCNNRRVHRVEPAKKVQLFEKRADAPSVSMFPGSSIRVLAGGGIDYDSREAAAQGVEQFGRDRTNLLGDLNGECNVGPTEMEFLVQLPGCKSLKDREKGQQIHFDTTFSNIQVHHWIKIVMRLSKPDRLDHTKRRHFEISIDSPLHILSCQATQANTALPAYSSPASNGQTLNNSNTSNCACSLSGSRHPGSNGSDHPTLLAPPPAVHIRGMNEHAQRPIHLIRNPSFNPPPFDAEQPPPLITPPPEYDSIVGHGEGLADYFARLADETGDEDELEARAVGRVDLPLTPGGRVNRSMDERRTWLPPGHVA